MRPFRQSLSPAGRPDVPGGWINNSVVAGVGTVSEPVARAMDLALALVAERVERL